MKKNIAMLLMLLSCMVTAHAENSVKVGTVEVAQGGTATVNIELDNSDALRGLQFDLQLPSGVSYVENSAQTGSRVPDHTLTTEVQTNGDLRFMLLPNSSQDITGNSGIVLSFEVSAPNETGTLTAHLVEVMASDGDAHLKTLDDADFTISVVERAYRLTVADADVEQGGYGTIAIALESNFDISIFKLTLNLPEGIDYVSCEKGERLTNHTVSVNEETLTFLSYSASNAAFTGNSGTILTVKVKGAKTLTVGDMLSASISGVELTTPSTQKVNPANVGFQLNISEPAYTELRDDAGDAPTASDGPVNVRVTRTLKPNVWNTICLPFGMTAEQMTEALGDNVELGDFAGCTTTKEGDDVTGITVNFTAVTEMEANHPYIIKITSDSEEAIEQFIVNGVTIEQPANNPSVNKNPQTVEVQGTDVTLYNKFVGSYVAGTTLKKNKLFLNGGKFYYTADNTKTMKAFRGYFDFYDVLAEVNSAPSRMRIVFDGEATAIESVQAQDGETGVYYNLQGVAVENPDKGLYIKNGKKVVIK